MRIENPRSAWHALADGNHHIVLWFLGECLRKIPERNSITFFKAWRRIKPRPSCMMPKQCPWAPALGHCFSIILSGGLTFYIPHLVQSCPWRIDPYTCNGWGNVNKNLLLFLSLLVKNWSPFNIMCYFWIQKWDQILKIGKFLILGFLLQGQ